MDRRPLGALTAALTLMTAPAAFGASTDPPAAAGWHGREIRDPLPNASAKLSRGFRAAGGGQRRRGKRLHPSDGSRRVREVHTS